jgi:hypothetical protein
MQAASIAAKLHGSISRRNGIDARSSRRRGWSSIVRSAACAIRPIRLDLLSSFSTAQRATLVSAERENAASKEGSLHETDHTTPAVGKWHPETAKHPNAGECDGIARERSGGQCGNGKGWDTA